MRRWLKRAGEEASGSTGSSSVASKRTKVDAVKADDQAQASPIERLSDAVLETILEGAVSEIPDEYDFMTSAAYRIDGARQLALVNRRWRRVCTPILWSTMLLQTEKRSRETLNQMYYTICRHVKWMRISLPANVKLGRSYLFRHFSQLATLHLNTFGPIAATASTR